MYVQKVTDAPEIASNACGSLLSILLTRAALRCTWQLTNVFQVIYPPAMGAAKYFICVQLKRIFCPHGASTGSVWWALQTLIVAIVGYYFSCFWVSLFQCVPREKIWHPAIAGRCIDNERGVLSAGLINLILDLGLLAIPCWAIWHLQMPLKRRLAAISIFAVGIL